MLPRRVFCLLLSFLFSGCESGPKEPPTQTLAAAPADLPAQYAPFYGIWSGKWDDTWDVKFVIDQITSTGEVQAEYYWKEHVPGPWIHHPVTGDIHGRELTLGVITITLDPSESTKAVAVGNFQNTRTAKLTKL